MHSRIGTIISLVTAVLLAAIILFRLHHPTARPHPIEPPLPGDFSTQPLSVRQFDAAWFRHQYSRIQKTQATLVAGEEDLLAFEAEHGAPKRWNADEQTQFSAKIKTLLDIKRYRWGLTATYNYQAELTDESLFTTYKLPGRIIN